MNTETQAIHSGHTIDPVSGAITLPIHLATTFEREADGTYSNEYVYTRYNNPNREALEQRLSALEGGAEAAAFGSGSVTVMSVLQALSPQDHMIAPDDLYFGIRQIIQDIFMPWGLQVTFVDTTDLGAVEAAMQANTLLVMVESPSNPLLKVTDIEAVADIAHRGGAVLMVDNTIATPVLQQPLAQGADLVVHATTKYIAGHSDVLGGIVITKQVNPLFEKIRFIQRVGGAVGSPFDCWLILRGLQTLPYRVRAHADNALKVARFLADHPAVEQVNYPGLESTPTHTVAIKQMKGGFGGLMSVQVKGGQDEALTVTGKVKLFSRATSFGGTHSLIEHRASIEAPGSTTPKNLLRLSIGLENAADLIADLDQALA